MSLERVRAIAMIDSLRARGGIRCAERLALIKLITFDSAMATSFTEEIATIVGGVDVGAETILTLVAVAGAGTTLALVAITGAGVFVGGRLVGVSDGVTRLRNGNGSSVVLIAVPLVDVMKTICVG